MNRFFDRPTHLRQAAVLSAFLSISIGGCDPAKQTRTDSFYAPPPDANYSAEEVILETTDGRTLAGTLTLPNQTRPAPSLVMITGSGLQDRDEHIRGVGRSYRPFRQIADTLSRRGIATLRLDDPGIGGSDPFPPGATPFTYGDDIVAALDFLRKHPGVDPNALAVLGHSEGAVIAPYVAASDSLVSAVVLLAAPAYTLERIDRFQRGKMFERLGDMSPEKARAEVERTAQSKERVAARDPWRGAVWDYDPLPTARSIRVPILLLHGESDQKITADQSDTLAAAFEEGGNADVTVRKFPATNHFFLRPLNRDRQETQASRSDQLAPNVLGLIADWLVERLTSQEAGHDQR